MVIRRVAMVGCLLAASACATPSGSGDLRVVRECSLACAGDVGTTLPELAPAPPASSEAAADFTARVRVCSIELDRIEAWLPGASLGSALIVPTAALERLAAAHAGELAAARPFGAPAGEARSLTIVDETSFVSGYRFETAAAAYLADPQVGVYQTGVRVVLEPRRDGDSWEVALALVLIDAAAGLEAKAPLIAGAADVRFDVPLFAATTASTTATLASGESLVVITPQPLHAGRVHVVTVEY